MLLLLFLLELDFFSKIKHHISADKAISKGMSFGVNLVINFENITVSPDSLEIANKTAGQLDFDFGDGEPPLTKTIYWKSFPAAINYTFSHV